MKPIAKLKNARNYALLFGLIVSYLSWTMAENQGLCIIVSGIAILFACLDELLLLMAENREPEKASPVVGLQTLCLVILMLAVPFVTATQAVRYFKAQDNVAYMEKKEYSVVKQVYRGDTFVELKDSYKDKPVTVIADSAFWGRDKLEKVVFPSSLKKIKQYAFRGCSSLTDVTLNDGLETIGNMAFRKCKSLSRVTIPASVTKISNTAFSGCAKELTVVGVPGSEAEAFAARVHLNFEAMEP